MKKRRPATKTVINCWAFIILPHIITIVAPHVKIPPVWIFTRSLAHCFNLRGCKCLRKQILLCCSSWTEHSSAKITSLKSLSCTCSCDQINVFLLFSCEEKITLIYILPCNANRSRWKTFTVFTNYCKCRNFRGIQIFVVFVAYLFSTKINPP